MISPMLVRAVADARSSLEDEREWAMMNFIPMGTGRSPGVESPREYLDFLRIADGGIFGQIVVFDAETVGRMQFYADEVDGAPVPLGRGIWFCFGKVNEDPVFLDRRDGSVWGFPERGVTWWQSDTFEQFADNLGEFLETYVLGLGYAALTGATQDEQWRRLLAHIGRA